MKFLTSLITKMKNPIEKVEDKSKEISQKVEQNEQKIGERKKKENQNTSLGDSTSNYKRSRKKEIFDKIVHETFPKPKSMNFQIERVYHVPKHN